MKKITLLSTIIPFAFLASLAADEVTGEISAALTSYEAGEFSAASTALQQASVLVSEKKAEAIAKAFPEKIGDWKAGEVENNSAGMGILGGGTVIKRTYTKGKQSVSIQLIADSPMVAQYIGILNNPAMAGAMGLKRKKVGAEKGLYNAKNHAFHMIVQNRFMIQINDSKASEADVLALAAGIDTKVLTNLK